MRTSLLCLLLAAPFASIAQDPPKPAAEAAAEAEAPRPKVIDVAEKAGVKFNRGPARQDIGGRAEIIVPEGYVATNGDGSRTILKLFDNLTGENEVGLFAPESFNWFVTFDWDGIGYVKDDEKDKLDAKKMLKSMQENNEEVNKIKKEQGLGTFTITGFDVPPNYNPETNNLEWALRLKDDASGQSTVNYNVKVLGREGVMVVTLVCDPADLTGLLPEFRKHLATFGFTEGHKYAEFKKGDKIAKVGLSALVVGGGLAIAAKTGLLKKLIKPLILAVVAAGAWLKKLFTGRSSSSS
ncbi:MAG: DUF2167 domain-containing protein [Kiritimatiellia bacterium]